ncbi:MAG: beta-ketoacyl-[acyl-carrier-protein] synthase family protein [Planctomycetes bacterium]|nr:beta-ketoacyl-[acyl-carrier-protein] synthase family protein [Planctomycetota bacterium]
MGAVTPLGSDVRAFLEGLLAGRSAVRFMEGWDRYRGLRSLVGAPAELREATAIPRKDRRSMGRMSLFAAQAAKQAVLDAGLSENELGSGRTGCVIGSTMGSACSINETFETMLPERDLSNLTAMQFFKCVSHSAAMNVAQYLNIAGVVMAPSAACASGLQAIGTGYDLIRLGRQEIVVCGGAEELHPTVTGSFDILFATSARYNDVPERTPRPFDRDRDGLVCGEGSGIVVLEEYERARRRNARMRVEVVGYHTCASGSHVSQSNHASMIACMREALGQAGVAPGEIDYINAHATGTEHGDAEETIAIREVFGGAVPVSSMKGALGHTLGASGCIEIIGSVGMMEKGVLFPTRNLENVAPNCAGILHVREPLERQIRLFLKNSFAFGGINAALVCRAV